MLFIHFGSVLVKYLTLMLGLFVTLILGCNPPIAELSKRDQVRIAIQKLCPVTGEKLGELGTPIQGAVGEETLFFCCRDCLTEQTNSEHLKSIHASFAKAQGICPVMKEPLPEEPKSTVVEGQIVFVCCAPCSKKIKADPVKFLDEINTRYIASLSSETNSDAK